MSRSRTSVAAWAEGPLRLHSLLVGLGLGVPPTGLARARWFYWAFSFAISVSCIPAIVLQADVPVGGRAAGLVGLVTLMGVRVREFRRGRLLPSWTEVPQAVALALAATAAGPLAGGLGLFFSGCFFRAVYASTRRTVLVTVGAVALLAACASTTVPGWQRTFVSQAFGIVVATLLTRVLVATLTRQNELVVRNERLLTAVFDNLDVAVMVGGNPNAAGMMNRAARGLHDGLGLPEAPLPWHDTVAVYEGDGRTPLPPEEMPAALALRGERVRDKALVLGLADGTRRYYSVNAARFGDADATSQVVVTVQEVTAQREAQLDLAHLAAHDPLTGLADRTLLTEAVEAAVAAMRDGGARVSLLLLDLDGFKRINDSLGHAWDQVLQAVAARLGDIAASLSASGLPPGALTLEITESALVDNSVVVLERLRVLKELGVMIAVDDFGTGYSSLSRLRTFPVDVLKIDRSFVQDVESHAGRALVKAIVALSDAIGLDTVAEGVESAGQALELAALGCRTAQGYHFARPAPASSMSWVARPLPA